MISCALILFETGLGLEIPGLTRVAAAYFPFWGSLSLLDCTLSNFMPFDDSRRYLVTEARLRQLQPLGMQQWQKEPIETVPLQGGLDHFIELLKSVGSPMVILASTSAVALYKREHLYRFANRSRGRRIVKVAVEGIPMDLYIAERKHLIRTVASYKERFIDQASFSRFLFGEILHTAFETMADIPGTVLYQGNLTRLYRENLSLLDKMRSKRQRPLLGRLLAMADEGTPTHVGEKGVVRNSFLSPGVEVRGTVERSVIFPGVSIEEQSRITNSVIMNNNQIGKSAVVTNSLLLPYQKEVMKGSHNIEDGAVIGGSSLQPINRDFPEQINGGLTVIGPNGEIPRRTKIEQGCYIGPDVPVGRLKKLEKIKKGSSLYSEKGQRP
jgi:ADP-glucose pyrophosphorylase